MQAAQDAYHAAEHQAAAYVHSACTLDAPAASGSHHHTTTTTAAAAAATAPSSSGFSKRIIGDPFAPPQGGGHARDDGGGGGWAAVEVAAHRSLMMYGKVRAQLVQLESLARCRHR